MTVSQAKARKILRDGKAHGKKLTAKQKRFFGARAGGAPVRKSPKATRRGEKKR